MHKYRLVISLAFIGLDYVLVFLAFSVAYGLREQIDGIQLIPYSQFLVFAFLASFLYVVIFAYLGLYDLKRRKDTVDQLFLITIGAITAAALAGAGIYFGKYFDYSRLVIGLGLLLSIGLVWVGHIFGQVIEGILIRRGRLRHKIVLIGGGEAAEMALSGYQAENFLGYQVLGLMTLPGYTFPESFSRLSIRNFGEMSTNGLDDLLAQGEIDEVVLTADASNAQILAIMGVCEEAGVRLTYIPDIFGVAISQYVVHDVAGMPLIEFKSSAIEGWVLLLKRFIDLILSVLGLVVLTPLFIVVAILIKLDSSGPVFFVHHRVGRFGKEFGLYKFRSMRMIEKNGQLLHASADDQVERLKEQQANYKLPDDPRITRVGRFIRKTSIDELPQLINVLRGELSLVGPRAYIQKELNTQLEKYPETKPLVRRLLTVKPGITGLWQISGRSNISFTERVAMDAHYATTATLSTDMKILLQTIPVVLKGSGAM